MAKATTWTGIDAEVRKRGEQTGLDTLVVHAVNCENQACPGLPRACPGQRDKFSAWGLRPQG